MLKDGLPVLNMSKMELKMLPETYVHFRQVRAF